MELLIILLLLIINGIFAMSEIAIVSARKTRLQALAEAGNSRAKSALELAENPNRFLSTTQIGITLIGILAGAFGGATIAGQLEDRFDQIDLLQPYSNFLAVIVVVVATTYFSLVVGELVPKRLGLQNPERVAMIVAKPMRRLSIVTAPLVALLSKSTDAILMLMGAHQSNRPELTEDDVTALILQGTEDGIFEHTEHSMVVGVLSLDDVSVEQIMTPRTEIEWLDLEDSLDDMLKQISESPHTHFPVSKEQLDHLEGILAIKDLLNCKLTNQPIELKSLLRPPLYVPETQVLTQTLETFKRLGQRMALVIDEHGGIEGMVTMTDILEEIVGDVSQGESQVIQRADGSWLMDGLLPVSELEELLSIEDDHTLEDEDFQTLGGFVMQSLGRVPTSSDTFEWQGFRFEVMDMDGRRVDKVLVSKINAEKSA